MTNTERRACFQEARRRILQAVKDEIAKGTNKGDRDDLTRRIDWDMDIFLQKVKGMTFEKVCTLYGKAATGGGQ